MFKLMDKKIFTFLRPFLFVHLDLCCITTIVRRTSSCHWDLSTDKLMLSNSVLSLNYYQVFIYDTTTLCPLIPFLDERIKRGWGGGGWKSQKYRVSWQYRSRSPKKITKLPSQHSTLSHHRHASETPFQWLFAAGPMMAPLNYKKKKKKKKKKKLVKVGPDPLWQNFLDPRMIRY